MTKKIDMTVYSCKECPFHQSRHAHGGDDHDCRKGKFWLSEEHYEGNTIHPDCPLPDAT